MHLYRAGGVAMTGHTCAERREMPNLQYSIETEEETDGRWIAEITNLPGVMAYGQTKDEAIAAVEALALRVIADEIEASKAGQSPDRNAP